MKKNKFYVVNAYRWGERENHSYFVGICNRKEKAIKMAKEHEGDRGLKYECEVIECNMNDNDDENQKYIKNIRKEHK